METDTVNTAMFHAYSYTHEFSVIETYSPRNTRDCMEQGSHAEYPHRIDTLCLETARVVQKEESDTRIIVNEEQEIWK